MSLNDSFPRCVAFVVANRPDKNTGFARPTPIGTAFFVGVTLASGAKFTYAVTARHVVDCESETSLRINLLGGGWEDIPIPAWRSGPSVDAAIAEVFPEPGRFDLLTIPLAMFADGVSERPKLGDPVYFIGLLDSTELADRNVPVVRSGTLAAAYQERIAMTHCDRSVVRIQAHVIDCRSYSGFSGSPCFVEFRVPKAESRNQRRADVVVGNYSLMPEIWLVGLVSGHWDKQGTGVLSTGEEVEFPINSGVGLVTPVEAIRGLLVAEDVATRRGAIDDALTAARREAESLAAGTPDTLDSAARE